MNTNRPTWTKPWSYKEGILISLSLLVLGFGLEYLSNGIGTDNLLIYPNNLYMGIIIVTLILFLAIIGKSWTITEWLQSTAAAICSIGLLLLVSLLMGLTLQYDDGAGETIRRLGLSHILTSWQYLLANLLLLLSLGLTTIKSIWNFSWNKLGFTISHLGLWIVIFGGNFGSIQLERLQVKLIEGEISNIAHNKSGSPIKELPFAIKLNDFILEEYNPKIALVYNEAGIMFKDESSSIVIAELGNYGTISNWNIEILEYIYSSAKAGNKYYQINEPGAAPSAFIRATNLTGTTVEGWVHCGSFNRQYESLKLDDEYSAIMLFPEPKEYISKIEILTTERPPESISLEVNKPYYIDGWKLYQMGYDYELGRWSNTSIIEVIRDPWLRIVYAGIFMMLAGAMFMFWVGSKKNMK